MPWNQNYPSKKINTNKKGLQQMDIPPEKGVNKDNDDFNDLKKEDLGIHDSEAEVVETPLEENEVIKHILLEE